MEGLRDFLSTWEDLRVEVDGYRELDDERVLVFHHFSGRARTSGLKLEEMRPRTANLFHVRDNKVTRLIAYYDRERALADLGLAPERRETPR